MRPGRALVPLGALLFLSVGSQSQDWKQVGPAPIENSRGGGPSVTASGLVNDIAIDPTSDTDSIIYIATSGGGIWRTTDRGGNWSPLTDLMPVQTMGTVALDPNDPRTVYAGVGSCYWYCLGGGGIYTSPDGGSDWTVLNPKGIFTGVQISRIVMPTSETLLVATDKGLYKSIDGGQHFGNNPRQFNNSLSAYDNSLPIPITTPDGIISNGNISDLKLDTVTPTTVYAAVEDEGLYKSTDAGSTFPASGKIFSSASFPPTITGGVFIKFAQSTLPDNQTMYAFLCAGASRTFEPCALLKSVNGGTNFSGISLSAGMSDNQQNYDQVAGVDPQDANKVYVGLRRLWFSGDGGTSLSTSNEIDPDPSHPDVHAITFSTSRIKGRPTRVFIGSDGGLSSTAAKGSAPGSQWQYLNHGLATVLHYGMDMGRGSIANNAYIYGATQDNGINVRTASGSGANNWNPSCCGDSLGVAVDPKNPTHAFGINSPSCGPFVSLGWPGPSFPGNLCLVSFDPNGGTAYASAGPQLFVGKSNATASILMHTFPQNVTAMNQAKTDSNTIWVGLDDGTVQYTHNALQGAASMWKALTNDKAPLGQAVTGIATDPGDSTSAVVVYPGFNGFACPASYPNCLLSKHVFRTIHDGATWSNISGTPEGGDNDLPDLPLYAVVIVPYTSPPTIVVGSDAGVMQSPDMGKTWQVLGTGFPTVRVTALAFDPAPEVGPPVLRASTFGRSVFELPFYPDPPQCKATTLCSGALNITCTGLDVGIDFSPCSSPNGEPVKCSAGFNGSSTVSFSAYPATPEGKACTVNEGARTCVQLDFPFGGEPSGPPGLPCPVCEAGQRWCDKYNPPRCVSEQDCTITPTHPNQPTPP